LAGLTLRVACLEDSDIIGENLRDSDTDECLSSCGISGTRAVKASFLRSHEAWVYLLEGEPIAMFGWSTRPTEHDMRIGWLLASKKSEKVSASVWAAASKEGLALLLSGCVGRVQLVNCVKVDNIKTIRWLGWLGARFFPPIPFGVKGDFFQQFVITKETGNV